MEQSSETFISFYLFIYLVCVIILKDNFLFISS